MNKTKIPWADYTWNPVTGCTPISEGCQNCYAKVMARRFVPRPGCEYAALSEECTGCKDCQDKLDYFKVRTYHERLYQPGKIKKASKIFVCSMGDLFHEDVPMRFIRDIFNVMASCKHHTFIVLTKKPERMYSLLGSDVLKCTSMIHHQLLCTMPLSNVWLGVTCETQKAADERIPLLLQTPAAKRFVSLEPLLENISLFKYMPQPKTGHVPHGPHGKIDPRLNSPCPNSHKVEFGEWCGCGIDWLIVGGETGPGARECREEWVQSIYDQCKAAYVSFFFKARGNNWKCNTECSGFRETTGNDCRNYCGFYIEWESRRAWPE